MRATFYTTEKLGPKQSLTPEGFLLCQDVPLARTGMMIYGPNETPIEAGPDGIVKIFREPEDVFTVETIASAQGKPVTNDHPDDDVTPENWKHLSHGVMMNVRRGEGAMDDLMIGDLLITTTEGIEAVRGGKVEVSLGYEADYEETGPGTGKQLDLVINHIALVEQGRCGPRCAIGDSKSKTTRGDSMATKQQKPSRILDALMRAFKAKDAAEVEELASEIQDSLPEAAEGGTTHIHVHTGSDPELPMTGDDATGEAGRTQFSDDDLQAFVERNDAEHAEMREQIAALQEALAALQGGAGSATGDDVDPEAVMDDEAPEEQMLDEVPEELREGAAKAKDSSYLRDSFKDTAALAEILAPGIRIPTFDNAARPGQSFMKICGLRRNALDAAYKDPTTRAMIADLLGGKPLNTKSMTCDAARTLFRSAAAMKRAANNAAATRTADTVHVDKKPAALSLADINKLNAKHYGAN